MSARVFIALGSPRKNGNTAALAAKVAEAAEGAGATVHTAFLQDLRIRACTSCGHCTAHGGQCVIDDDMQDLYPHVRAADALVIASPVYWFSLSAQTKLFMDRCYALLTDDSLRGKRVGIVLTYGASDVFAAGGVNALRTCQDAYAFVGAHVVGMVYGPGGEPGTIDHNQPLLERAAKLGRTLAAQD